MRDYDIMIDDVSMFDSSSRTIVILGKCFLKIRLLGVSLYAIK